MCQNMHNSHEYFNRKSGYTEERKKLHFPWNTLRTQQDGAIMVQSQQGALQDKEQRGNVSKSSCFSFYQQLSEEIIKEE